MIGSSKWMNFVAIQTNNQQSLQKIQSLGFVKKQYPIAKSISSIDAKETDQIKTDKNHLYSTENTAENVLNYGKSLGQISIHNGEYLHNKGFTGSGIKIAVFDAGFFKYQTYDAFDSLRKKDKIKYSWDFVSNHSSVNEDDPHGMSCLSIMGANLPGRFVYSDLNGTGTIVSKAASMAVAKGMIVTSSAGNEGDDPWKYISAPADGKNVLAVGAINTSNQIAPFSGFGPSADGRTKPDIVSVGFNTQLIASDGNVGIGNGTSFSNPNIAGLIACLWQSFPEFNNLEIIQAIKQSSHQYLNPDNRKGYGIPNMLLAHEDLNKQRDIRNAQKILIEKNIAVYPNPIYSYCKIAYKASQDGIFIWRLVNTNGQTIMSEKNSVKSSQYYVFEIKDLSSLSRGVYFLLYSNGTEKGTLKIIK
ncbi:MAG: S8 family serine peptidase [Chitinophagaceae bacterium]